MEHLINWKKTIASKYCVVCHNSFLGRKLKNAFLKSERLNITSKLNLFFHFKIMNTTVLLFKNPVQRNSMPRATWSGHTSQDKTCAVLGVQRLLPVVSFSYKITEVFRVVLMSTFVFLNSYSGGRSEIYSFSRYIMSIYSVKFYARWWRLSHSLFLRGT